MVPGKVQCPILKYVDKRVLKLQDQFSFSYHEVPSLVLGLETSMAPLAGGVHKLEGNLLHEALLEMGD